MKPIKNKEQAILKKAEPIPADEMWIDKQDIISRLHISDRTLQTWRTKGILPYSRIRRKIYYRESDLKKLLEGRRSL
jgi:hypothetical protein